MSAHSSGSLRERLLDQMMQRGKVGLAENSFQDLPFLSTTKVVGVMFTLSNC